MCHMIVCHYRHWRAVMAVSKHCSLCKIMKHTLILLSGTYRGQNLHVWEAMIVLSPQNILFTEICTGLKSSKFGPSQFTFGPACVSKCIFKLGVAYFSLN